MSTLDTHITIKSYRETGAQATPTITVSSVKTCASIFVFLNILLIVLYANWTYTFTITYSIHFYIYRQKFLQYWHRLRFTVSLFNPLLFILINAYQCYTYNCHFCIFSEPSSRVNKSTRSYTTHSSSSTSGGKQINRELHYDTSPQIVNSSQTTIRQSRSRQRSPTYERNIETKVTRDLSYDSDPTVDNVSTINRSYNYTKNEPQQVVPYNEMIDVDTTNLPDELNGLPLSGGILPGPGTKVTTTVCLFTYNPKVVCILHFIYTL